MSKYVSLLGKFLDLGPDRDNDQSLGCRTCALPKDCRIDLPKSIEQATRFGVIVSGPQVGTMQEKLMPALGDKPNIACYMDGLHVDMRMRCERARFAAQENEPEIRGKAETLRPG